MRDSATFIARSDGMPVRPIKPHTREKFYLHGRYCSIFNSGMQRQWRDNRGYLELFAGSGLAYDIDAGEEVEAAPLHAGTLSCPGFNKLAFVEYDQELALALETRLRARGVGDDRARVFAGDANDPQLLARAFAFLPDPGLIFVFIDPEDINNHWAAVEYIARAGRWQRKDLLINLPIGPMRREIGKHNYGPISRVMGSEEWLDEIERGGDLGHTLRSFYARQLATLGFTFVRHRDVHLEGSMLTLYDLVFASRNPRALEFWNKIQEIDVHGQRELKLFPDP